VKEKEKEYDTKKMRKEEKEQTREVEERGLCGL